MKIHVMLADGVALLLLVALLLAQSLAGIAAGTTNSPLAIAIVFPPSGVLYHNGIRIHIRVRTSDADGQVVAVNYYADDILIGTATNAPFNFEWYAAPGWYQSNVLTAVAVDNLGATNVSPPVLASFVQIPFDQNNFVITSPVEDLVLPAPATFPVSARLAESIGIETPAYFFLGTNLVGTVDDPPYSMIVSNLTEGFYRLGLGAPDGKGGFFIGYYRFITVVPLLIQASQSDTNRSFAFRAAGRVAGKATVVEASTNLVAWEPISTNLTSTNSFLFTDPQATNFSRRFYRASFKE
ncbi:MAG: Ig-like domain-containing protein [Verrucomicrobia bacterium]|nr:Ig-like domain-containing protein [Verrucomicrobiota bacterium]